MTRRLISFPVILDDFQMTTWLAMGAFMFAAVIHYLPLWVAIQFPILLLGMRTVKTVLIAKGVMSAPPSNTLPGRYTTQIPDSNGEKQKGVLVFVLGARINHPMGRFAPGFFGSAKLFTGMWRELANNRDKYGYLGKTSTLMGSQEKGGLTMVWLTYFKTPEGLRAFATSEAHRALQLPWLAKKYPYLGIMHETYYATNGNWETIYHNFQPFGMGKTKFVVDEDGKGDADPQETHGRDHKTEGPKLASSLVEAEGYGMRSMFGRMGSGGDIAAAS